MCDSVVQVVEHQIEVPCFDAVAEVPEQDFSGLVQILSATDHGVGKQVQQVAGPLFDIGDGGELEDFHGLCLAFCSGILRVRRSSLRYRRSRGRSPSVQAFTRMPTSGQHSF